MQGTFKPNHRIWQRTLVFGSLTTIIFALICASSIWQSNAQDPMDDDMDMRPFVRPIGMAGAKVDDGFVPNGSNDPTYTTLDYPNASLTAAFDINNSGQIVGFYRDSAVHGFLFNRVTRSFASIDYTDPVCKTGTDARGVNERGDIVGTCTDSAGNFYGYLLTADGFSPVFAPGHLSTIAQRLSSDGDNIVGCVHDTNMTTTMFGMSHDSSGFEFFGGAFGGLNGIGFMHNGVTPDGEILVGLFMDTTFNRARAYILKDGIAIPFDYPGATLTQAWDVNAQGDVVGVYRDTAGRIHGFLRSAHGEFTPIDVPNATLTRAFGINASGDIVGTYIMGGVQHAFVRSGKSRGNQ